MDSNDSIFIEDTTELKKYQKKLRHSKTPQKSKEFQDAIDDYHFRHQKVVKNKNIKTMKNKVVSDDELLDKAIRENNGVKVVIESDKDIKAERRIEHMKIVNRKKIMYKIGRHIEMCMRKYLMHWIKINNQYQNKNNNMIDVFKYTQKHIKAEIILKKWKFQTEFMISRYNMKCRFHKSKQITTVKINIMKHWHMLASHTGIKCNVCYDDYNKDNIVTTNCGHEFCNGCINKWKNKCFRKYKDASCPLCRQVFEYRPYDYREPIEQYQETLIDNVERGINQIHFDPNNPEIINREEVNVDMSGIMNLSHDYTSWDLVQRRLDFELAIANTFTNNNNNDDNILITQNSITHNDHISSGYDDISIIPQSMPGLGNIH